MKSCNCFWDDLFSDDEIEKIKKYCESLKVHESTLMDETTVDNVMRKSKVSWLHKNQDTNWIFSKFDHAINKTNTEYFGFDIYHLDTLQYTVYDGDNSHYDWHWDMYDSDDHTKNIINRQRKVTAVLQLSDDEDYEGGELLYSVCGTIYNAPKKKGHMTIFPSFVLHKVEPVTKGKRKTLVAWFTGPDWR